MKSWAMWECGKKDRTAGGRQARRVKVWCLRSYRSWKPHSSVSKTIRKKHLLLGFWGDQGTWAVWKGQGLGPGTQHCPECRSVPPLHQLACFWLHGAHKFFPEGRECAHSWCLSTKGTSSFLLVPEKSSDEFSLGHPFLPAQSLDPSRSCCPAWFPRIRVYAKTK